MRSYLQQNILLYYTHFTLYKISGHALLRDVYYIPRNTLKREVREPRVKSYHRGVLKRFSPFLSAKPTPTCGA